MFADKGSSVSPGVAIRPTTEELVARARALLPRLRERAGTTEELRRIPDETIDEFREAGFFRLFQPVRYGGYELDYGAVQVDRRAPAAGEGSRAVLAPALLRRTNAGF